MSVIEMLDVIWLIAVIVFIAMGINILRRFLLSDNPKDQDTAALKADKWKANSRNLYQSLKVLAYSLTILVVCLGVLTALDIFNFSEDGLTLPLLYMVAVAAGEASKIWTVQAFARHPSFSIFLTALIALCISIFFASESLFNISSQIQKHSNQKIDQLLSERATNTSLIEGYDRQVIALRNKKAFPAQESEELIRLQSSLSDLNTEIGKFFAEKEEIFQANNKTSKKTLSKEIITIQNLQNKTNEKIAAERDFYSSALEKLNKSRSEAVSEANFSRKRSVDLFYQERISELDINFRQQIRSLEAVSSKYRKKIEDTTTKAESLNKLSWETKEKLKEIDMQVQKAEAAKEQIVEKLNFISKQKDLDANILVHDIEELQGLRDSLLEVQIHLEEKIAKLKNENFLYVLASSFYGKPPLEVTAEEQLSFSKYFIGLSAIFLALLPSLLAVLSVMLEKAVERPSPKKLDLKVLFIDCMKAINLSIQKGFKELSSQKVLQKRLSASYKSRIQKEREGAQKKLAAQRQQFERELFTKDSTITQLEKEQYLRATKARHERNTKQTSKELKELELRVENLQKLLEAEKNAKKEQAERKVFEEEQTAERRLLLHELMKLLKERNDEED